jgi:hypothetical protein
LARYKVAMAELEQRIAAHELALIEVVAHVDRDQVVEGMKTIRAGLIVGSITAAHVQGPCP